MTTKERSQGGEKLSDCERGLHIWRQRKGADEGLYECIKCGEHGTA